MNTDRRPNTTPHFGVSPRYVPPPPVRHTLRVAGALLRIAACALLAVVVAAALAVAGLWLYLASDARKTLTDVPALHGGSLSFGSVGLSDPRDYPDVRLRLDDVRLSDRAFDDERRDVLRFGRLRLDLLADLRSDTLATVRRLTLRGGHLRLHTDSTGVSNLARLLGRGGGGTPRGTRGIATATRRTGGRTDASSSPRTPRWPWPTSASTSPTPPRATTSGSASTRSP